MKIKFKTNAKSKKTKKKILGQSAFEYFITYSWAVALVAITLIVLFSTGFPGLDFLNVEKAELTGLEVLDFKADTNGDLVIKLGNSVGHPITLTGVAKVNGVATTISPVGENSVNLKRGESLTYVIRNALPDSSAGAGFNIESLSIDYVDQTTGITHAAHGFIMGSVEEITESTATTSFDWSTKEDFNSGSHDATAYSSGSVTLTGNRGAYVSEIRDAGEVVNFTNVTIEQQEIENPASVGTALAVWDFNEESCIVPDKSGNQNNAQIGPNCTEGERKVPGVFGTALAFNGVDDQAHASNSVTLNPDSFSIEMWLYVNGTRDYYRLIEKGSEAKGGYYKVKIVDSNKIKVYLKRHGAMISNNSIQRNQWNHLVITYQENSPPTKDIGRIYINGKLEAEISKNDKIGKSPDKVYIGYHPDSNNPLEGFLDEIRIYNRALDESEVQSHNIKALTDLTMQVRSCDDSQCNGESFKGPDGTPNTVYRSSKNLQVAPNRYIQYRVLMSTENLTYYPPKLFRITIKAKPQ